MGFGEWYVRRGRIGPRTWWLHYFVPLVVLALLAGLADGALGYPGLAPGTDAQRLYAEGLYAWTGGPLGLSVLLFSVVPTVSSQVTRLHDRGHSAWWLLLNLVPLVGPVVLFVQMGFLPGAAGPNDYGYPEGWIGDRLGAGVDTWG
jgi:uncharacterized membrane protein YhaH (DUF805 family)